MDSPSSTLYYGDNLDILRRYIDDESVDLIYLDPPFNSNADYNLLFAEKDGTQAHAQIKAFEDTWTWDLEAAQEYAEVLRSGHDRIAKALKGLHDFLGGSDMLAYLAMMALRLIELHRDLKSESLVQSAPVLLFFSHRLNTSYAARGRRRSELIHPCALPRRVRSLY